MILGEQRNIDFLPKSRLFICWGPFFTHRLQPTNVHLWNHLCTPFY